MAGLLLALVTVVVHNTAQVPYETLVRAQTETERLFANAGVAITWTEAAAPATLTIHVIIRRQPGGGPGGSSPSALGTTLGDDHSGGGSSFIFYDRVLKFAHAHTRAVDVILAYAIAHELGHVLLPSPAHTEAGLMKGEWSEDDLRRFAREVRFTESQAASMQALLLRCCGQ
jgi:hypothetical protein